MVCDNICQAVTCTEVTHISCVLLNTADMVWKQSKAYD